MRVKVAFALFTLITTLIANDLHAEIVKLTVVFVLDEDRGTIPAGTEYSVEILYESTQIGMDIVIPQNVYRFEIQRFFIGATQERIEIPEIEYQSDRYIVIGNDSPIGSNVNFMTVFIDGYSESEYSLLGGQRVESLAICWEASSGGAFAGYTLPNDITAFNGAVPSCLQLDSIDGDVLSFDLTAFSGSTDENRNSALLNILIPMIIDD